MRVRHQCGEVAFQGRKIELFEFRAVVEVRRHGIGSIVVLVKDLEADRFGPPVLIGGSIAGMQIGALCNCTARMRALGFGSHGNLFDFFSSGIVISPCFYIMGSAVLRHDFRLSYYLYEVLFLPRELC